MSPYMKLAIEFFMLSERHIGLYEFPDINKFVSIIRIFTHLKFFKKREDFGGVVVFVLDAILILLSSLQCKNQNLKCN